MHFSFAMTDRAGSMMWHRHVTQASERAIDVICNTFISSVPRGRRALVSPARRCCCGCRSCLLAANWCSSLSLSLSLSHSFSLSATCTASVCPPAQCYFREKREPRIHHNENVYQSFTTDDVQPLRAFLHFDVVTTKGTPAPFRGMESVADRLMFTELEPQWVSKNCTFIYTIYRTCWFLQITPNFCLFSWVLSASTISTV